MCISIYNNYVACLCAIPINVFNTITTFLENFPPGKSQISIHQGSGQIFLCNYNLPFIFHSKLESIRNLLELTTDPISVVANAFGLKETDYASVDVMLESNFKLNVPPNFNLLQNSYVDPNKILNSGLHFTYVCF